MLANSENSSKEPLTHCYLGIIISTVLLVKHINQYDMAFKFNTNMANMAILEKQHGKRIRRDPSKTGSNGQQS